ARQRLATKVTRKAQPTNRTLQGILGALLELKCPVVEILHRPVSPFDFPNGIWQIDLLMVLMPRSRDELSRTLAEAGRSGVCIERVDLPHINVLLEHKPEDMTATVEAGMTLSAFQEQLGRARQWLPIDPPNAEVLTIGDLLAYNFSGPRR